MTPVLTATRLTQRYGDLIALDGVSVTIGRGESVAIMGASGSGKTTLLHALAAVSAVDAGSISLFVDPTGPPLELVGMTESQRSAVRREHVGFVFQEHLLLPELTALENAALPLLVLGMPRRDADQRAAAWLAALGLAGMEDRRIGQLSGGQAQRVAIARAQVAGAPVVFADEPTGALDSHTSDEVMTALLHATTGQGRSLVVVTHDAGVAARCDRALRMRDGHLTEEGVDAATAAPAPVAAAVPAASTPAFVAPQNSEASR
ncbi:ABC transporter ATP-binding protein [Microbacterium horticulturae]|uniref:ABC transporter ATP-binding protein n=1 Tax=Microbacterium horticulturae TaxID=3028316 RepID=A0ABY8C3Y2_9MICO|nr:ABC transporter ATP-binding protein [Microbacterium sp. KACC 23027]WEG09333.1 ABC transporter ATP-binding protein [Microbacterium sp. KACC 23027]